MGFMILLLAVCVCSIKVDPETSLFVDQYNRFRIYHGVNAVFKTSPFYPDTEQFSVNFSLTDTDLYNLRNWGMNVIRLHVAW
jgi:endoglycosylceramidase